MKIQLPIDTTSFTTTNVPENDYPVWKTGTTYNIGDTVMLSHDVYRSAIDGNVGKNPPSYPNDWQYIGKTNAYKCLDNKVNTQTVNNTTIILTFPVGKSTSITFLNVECRAIKLEVIDQNSQVVFTETRGGIHRDVVGWYSYFINEFAYVDAFLFEHVYNPLATYRVTLTGEVCKIGIISKGTTLELGQTLWGYTKGFYDYSKKEENEWGEIELVEGNYRDYWRGEILVATSMLDIVGRILRKRRGKLTMFIPTERYDSMIYGFVREPDLIWERASSSVMTFDIEGVV